MQASAPQDASHASASQASATASASHASASQASATASASLDYAGLVGRPQFVCKERGGAAGEELVAALSALRVRDPALFLERYGGILDAAELRLFDDGADYEVRWWLTELRRTTEERTQQRRNRRFRAMEQMIASGHEYFSEARMRDRDPALYHTLVGAVVGGGAAPERFDKECTLSERLLANLDADENRAAGEAAAEAARAEAGASGGGERDAADEDDYVASGLRVLETEAAPAAAEADDELEGFSAMEAEADGEEEEEAEEEAEARAEREAAAAAEREAAAAMGRVELLEAMKRRFLDGEAAFDYSEIDAHSGYDDLQQEGRDLEERWFDDDD